MPGYLRLAIVALVFFAAGITVLFAAISYIGTASQEKALALEGQLIEANQSIADLQHQREALEKEKEVLMAATPPTSDRERNLQEEVTRLSTKVAQLVSQLELHSPPPPGTEDAIKVLAGLSTNPTALVDVRYGALVASAFQLGEASQAISYYDKLAAEARDAGYVPGEAAAYDKLAIASQIVRDADRAKEFRQTATALAAQLQGEVAGLLTVYENLDITEAIVPQLDAAKTFHESALRLAEETEYQWGRASANLDLGVVWFLEGDVKQAVGYTGAALGDFEAMGDEIGIAMALNNMAVLHERDGRIDDAAEARNELQAVIEGLKE